MKFNPDPKPPVRKKKKATAIKPKRYNGKYDYPTDWKFKTEKEMFEYLWATWPHKSFLSGKVIREAKPENFAHVLPKALNRYPKYRLNPNNIIFLTREEHFLFDHGNSGQREKYEKLNNCLFGIIKVVERKLKLEYEERYTNI